MMHKIVAGVCMIFGLVFVPDVHAFRVNATVTEKILSEYVVSNGSVVHDRPVSQLDLFVEFPDFGNYYVDVWWSSGFNDDFSGGFDDEIDGSIGCAPAVGGFAFNFGLDFFDTVDLFSGDGPVGDMFQLHGEVAHPFSLGVSHILTPYVRLEIQLPIREEVEDGLYTHVGVRHVWSMAPFLSLYHQWRFFHDTGAYGFKEAIIGRYDLSLNWKWGDAITVHAPLLIYSDPLTSVPDDRKGEFIYGIGFNITF